MNRFRGSETVRSVVWVTMMVFVVDGWFWPGMADAQTQAVIAAWTKTGRADETVLLVGENLGIGQVVVDDGDRVEEARIIDNGDVTFRNSTRLMAVVPESMATGTLWCWLRQGQTRVSNIVRFNAPEPWWVQPDRIDIGEKTRIFGRNLDSNTGQVGGKIRVKLTNDENEFFYDARLTAANVIELEVSSQSNLTYGDYDVYIQEPKNSDFYGPVSLTLEPAYERPAYVVDVGAYGAIPNDGIADNNAFVTAIGQVASRGGGTVQIPGGTFLLDDSRRDDMAAAVTLPGAGARYSDGVCIRGQGPDRTILKFAFTGVDPLRCDKIALYDHGALQDLCVQVVGDQYTGSDYTIAVRGDHCRIENVKIDSRQSGIYQHPILVHSEYVTIENVDILGTGAVEFRGRQIRISGVNHRGPMPQDHYPQEDQDNSNFAPDLFVTMGISELVFENNFGRDLWEQYPGAHFKRFFGAGSHWGGVYHAYLAGNVVEDIKSQPFNNAAECILFEGNAAVYCGRVACDQQESEIVRLLDGQIAESSNVFSAYAQPQNNPLLVGVMSGTGMGQVRKGWARNATEIELSQSFAITPDTTSKVIVRWAFAENIISRNELIGASIYATASVGIQFYGGAVDNVVAGNRVEGFQVGYSDWVFGANANGGSCDGDEVPVYFNEVRDNNCVGTLAGVVTNITAGQRECVNALGNVYRGNSMEQMNCDLPQFQDRGFYCALGIVPWAARYEDKVGADRDAIVASIYESNVVQTTRRGFFVDKPVADWVVVRDNELGNAVVSGIYVDGSVDYCAEDNSVNTLPRIDILSATAPYRRKFKLPWATWTDAEVEKDYYVWSAGGQGSMTLRATDEDGDTVSEIQVNPSSVLIKAGNVFSWANVPQGIHVSTLEAEDGKGSGQQKIYLIVGEYDDFGGSAWIVDNNASGSQQSHVVETASGRYTTSVTAIFHEEETTWPHYHDVQIADDSLYGRRLWISPINEEISLTGESDNTLYPDAVLSMVKNHYHSAGSYMKMRLKRDDDSYYEFYDHVDLPLHFEIRRLARVVDGVETMSVSRLAAHNWESPVLFEKDGGTIKVSGWGDSIEMYDPAPFTVKEWEIVLASADVKDDAFSERYAYTTIDNLYFAKGNDIVTSAEP